VVCSTPGHLHTTSTSCRVHGNVTQGGLAGALGEVRTQPTVLYVKRAPPALGQGPSPVLRRDLFPLVSLDDVSYSGIYEINFGYFKLRLGNKQT
jgi:hypothetical protein